MSSIEETPTGSPEIDPQWVAELRALQAEEAIQWKGHEFDEDGWHDEDECRVCLESKAVVNDCRCGVCCRLLIEVGVEDAEREPLIREKGSPIYLPAEVTESGQKELVGYLLNGQSNEQACAFLDSATNLCQIHATRPLVCRLFDCQGEGREQLIELGWLRREQTA